MLDLIFALTAGGAFFLAFLVLTVRSGANIAANRWLGGFLFMLGIFLLDETFSVYGIYQKHPNLLGISGMSAFALSPALYLSVSQFVAVGRRSGRRDLWHFLPFLLFILLSLPFLLTASGELKLIEFAATALRLEDRIWLSLMVLQIMAYLFFSFQKLKKHRKHLKNITASPAGARLDWLFFFLIGVAAMVAVWFVELHSLGGTTDSGWINIAYFLAIYALGYFALNQKEVFLFSKKEAEAVGEVLEEIEMPPAARRSGLSGERLADLKIMAAEKMRAEKPHLDPELNLPRLAVRMGLGVHEMSELINSGFGENFAQFVNRHRVEESKRLLVSEKHAHLSMVGIAFESGFNSKTAFNTTFKKMTGSSPTEFQRQEKMAD